MIRDIKLFEKYGTSNNPSECIMTKCVEEKFRQIYSYGEEGKDKSEQVSKDPSRNKIKKVNLKKYLSEKYTPKVASKICNLFDWNNAMDHSMFFKHINDLFIWNPNIPASQINTNDKDSAINQHSLCLKQIAFFLFDINSDGSICQLDLFSNTKQFHQDFYINILDQDIKDIRARIEQRNKSSKLYEDQGLKETETEIGDIDKFLRHS